MTDVLITKRIPGHRAGDVVPREPRLEQHIKARNAKILPNEHEAWNGSQSEPVRPAVAQVIGTGSAADVPDLDAELEVDPDESDPED